MTAEEIAERLNMKVCTIRRRIYELMKKGKLKGKYNRKNYELVQVGENKYPRKFSYMT
jgi:predicted HTH transcriptional regulator